MKSESVNISMPAELAEFARQDMTLGAYGTLAEYVRDLLRKRRQERIDQDVRSLAEAIRGAPEDDPHDAFYARVALLQKEIRIGKRHGG
jgi:Arc/MetJ-type ribon-helix-helix transcriptional regulator